MNARTRFLSFIDRAAKTLDVEVEATAEDHLRMIVIVKLSWPIYKTVGARTLTLELDREETTIAEVVAYLDRHHPGFKDELARGTGDGLADYLFFVNETLVPQKDAATTSLHDGDKLFVILPIVGGASPWLNGS